MKNASPLSRKANGGQKNRRTMYVALAMMVAVLGLLVKVVLFAPPPREFDEFGCEVGNVKAHTVVIIDRTDVLTESKYRAVRDLVTKLGGELGVGEKLSIYEIDSGNMKGLSEPVFQHCRPRDGANANPLTENPQLLARAYDMEFREPLDHAIEQYHEGEEQPRSPIIECLMDLVHVPEFDDQVLRRRLVVFSDLLQHTALASHYSSQADYKSYVSNPARAQMVPDLRGVEVTLYYMLRQESGALARQNNKHVRFWLDFFEAAHARVKRVEKVR